MPRDPNESEDGATSLRLRSGPSLTPDELAYLDAHPHAAFGHAPAWRAVLRSTYLLPTFNVVARRDGQGVVGVAPFHLMVGPLGGAYLAISPFTSHGGVLAEDASVADALLARSRELAIRFGIRHLQLRQRDGHTPAAGPRDRVSRGRFVSPRVAITGTPADVFSRFEQRARYAVRKAERAGVRIDAGSDLADLDRVFALGMRALGSPFHGPRFFRAIRRHFGEDCVIRVGYHGDRPAAAALAIAHRDTLHYVYGQNVSELRGTCANTLVVWSLLQAACERGLRWVDLGRSEAGSSHELFKRQFGAEACPLTDATLCARAKRPPDLTPTNPRFAAAQRIWRRLPLWVTAKAGPLLIRGIA
jgi:serine/alanine adding enzyme